MQCPSNVVQDDIRKSVTGRTATSGPDLFVQAAFVHLSQEAAVSEQMCCTDAEGLSTRLGQDK